jgi:hypothetical protein
MPDQCHTHFLMDFVVIFICFLNHQLICFFFWHIFTVSPFDAVLVIFPQSNLKNQELEYSLIGAKFPLPIA